MKAQDTSAHTGASVALKMYNESQQISETSGLSLRKIPTQIDTVDINNQLARLIVGRKDSKLQSHSLGKVLMLVGATGAGKSTLINAMVNYLFGVEWEDNFRFKMIEEATKDQSKSVTKWVTAYTIPAQEGSPVPYTLTIIDTPGFGDTEGIEQDKIIVKQVKELFSKEEPGAIVQLHGIGFVTQAPLARLTYTQQYIFDSILAIFGKDIGKNVFMMTTFSDGQRPPVLEAVKAANIPHEPYFKFNNSAIYSENRKNRFDNLFWEMGMTTLKEFFAHLAEMTPISLLLTKVVLEERENLEVILQGLQEQIHRGLNKCEELRLKKEVVKEHEADIERNKEFTIKTTVEQPKKIPLKQQEYTTNCLKCNYTCHYPCLLPNNEDKKGCAAMKRTDNCTVCTGKCHWKQHVNDQFRVKWVTKEVIQTSEDLKKKYYNAKSGKSRYESIVAGLEQDLFQEGEGLRGNLEEARKCIKRLDEIALKPNPLSEVEYISLMIESEEDQKKPGFIQRVRVLKKLQSQAGLISKVRKQTTKKSSKATQVDWWAFWNE